jgi:hypothetical protein
MGLYVDRDGGGNVTGRFPIIQRARQEYLADGSAGLLALQLDDAKVAKKAEIESAYAAFLAQGMAYNGKTLQVDDDSQQKLVAVFAQAIAVQQGVVGVNWPSGGYEWRMADNSMVAFTVADFITMAQAAATYCATQFYARSAAKDQVTAATTIEAVAAIKPSFS